MSNPQGSFDTTSVAQGLLLDETNLRMRAPEWIGWAGVLCKGEVTLLIGLPSAGKSAIARTMAAAVTNGRPLDSILKYDDEPSIEDSPRHVLWVNTEESVEISLLPGLAAAGISPYMRRIIDARTCDVPLKLDQQGIEMLQESARAMDAGLVVLDGSDNFIPHGKDPNNGNDVDEMMSLLQTWATEDHIAILMFRHEGKSKRESSKHAGTGSIQWNAKARLDFSAKTMKREEDDEEPMRRLEYVKDSIFPVYCVEFGIKGSE